MKQLKKRLTKLEQQIKPEEPPQIIRVGWVDVEGNEVEYDEFTVAGGPTNRK